MTDYGQRIDELGCRLVGEDGCRLICEKTSQPATYQCGYITNVRVDFPSVVTSGFSTVRQFAGTNWGIPEPTSLNDCSRCIVLPRFDPTPSTEAVISSNLAFQLGSGAGGDADVSVQWALDFVNGDPLDCSNAGDRRYIWRADNYIQQGGSNLQPFGNVVELPFLGGFGNGPFYVSSAGSMTVTFDFQDNL